MSIPALSTRQRFLVVTLIDGLTALGLAAAIAVLLNGGDRYWLGSFRISIRDPRRVLLWTAALAALRWTLWRRIRLLPELRLQWKQLSAGPMVQRFARAAAVLSRSNRPDARQVVRTAARPWLRIGGASALIVAQPILDAVARSPEFLIAHEASRTDIVVVVTGLILLVPTLLTVPVLLAGLVSRRLQDLVESAILGGLISAFAMQVAKHANSERAIVAIPLALAIGLAASVAYHRATVIRSVATAASFALVVVPGLFLVTPGIRRLMAPPPGADVQRPRYADAAVRRGTAAPVVLLIFDETPLVSLLDANGAIDPHLYPAFAALARDGILFRNATTVADFTEWAVPAILSGRYPRPDQTTQVADHAEALYTLLGKTYRFEVFEGATDLCPADLCPPATPGQSERLTLLASDLRYAYLHAVATADLAKHLPSLTNNWRDFGDLGEWRRRGAEDQLRERPGAMNGRVAEEFLNRVRRDDGRPVLYVLHTLLQHFPHLQLPSGQFNGTRAEVPAFASPEVWSGDRWAVAQLHQRHLLQLRYVDAYLGRVLEQLRSAGVYRRALIVLTADHGISFEPATSRRSFSEEAAAEIMRVPLIVKLPERAKKPIASHDVEGQQVSDRNAQTVDILPTIADVLGIPLPWNVDGQPLFDASQPEPDTKQMYYAGALASRTFDRDGPDASAALQRKLNAFDLAGDGYFAPRPERFKELVGRPVRELRIEAGGGPAEIDYLSHFEDFHGSDAELPFDVAGRLDRLPSDPRHPTYVALAVNGVVRAVTHTWESEPQGWQATPAPSVWLVGRNDIEVFVIEGDDRAPLLRRCELGESAL